MTMNYREKTIRFGKSTPLLGVLTEPPAGTPANGRGVVLLNAGLLHRVGPSRLHVQVARRMASQGFQALRFDFSGIGDSDARRDGLAFEQSAVLEVQEAMDYLTGKGVQDFTLWGLCSGADAAFLTAVADARVGGVVQLDGWVYRTWRYHLHHYPPKLLRANSWRKLLPFLWHKLAAAVRPRAPDAANENVVVSHYSREFPPKAVVEQRLRTLLERRVRLYYLFSGGMPDHINHAAQFKDCFGALALHDLVTVRYEGSAEHMFSALHHQKLVVDSTSEWLNGVRPAAADESLALSTA
jgi:hypothetical protein